MSALSRAVGGFDYVGGPQWSPGWSVAAGDLNGDSRADLFLYNPVTGWWVEAFSDGVGGFTFSPVGIWDPGWTVGVTDFNDDGRGDIILSRPDGTWVQATNTGIGSLHLRRRQLGHRLDGLHETAGRSLDTLIGKGPIRSNRPLRERLSGQVADRITVRLKADPLQSDHGPPEGGIRITVRLKDPVRTLRYEWNRSDRSSRPAPRRAGSDMIQSRPVVSRDPIPGLRSRSTGIPLLLAALYASTALLWFVITPPFEAPDENAHYDFIAFLATERRLPDANPATRAGWNFQEWMQPPVYYALIAPVVALSGPDRNVFLLAPVNPEPASGRRTSRRGRSPGMAVDLEGSTPCSTPASYRS